MAFAFRLEKVLAVRRIEEDEAMERHARSQQQLQAAETARERVRAALQDAMQDFDRLKHGDAITVEALYLHSLHVAGLRRRAEVAEREHAAAAEQATRTSAALVEAHRARETLERLREREEAAWRQQQAKREADAIDEMAVSRHRIREEENHGP